MSWDSFKSFSSSSKRVSTNTSFGSSFSSSASSSSNTKLPNQSVAKGDCFVDLVKETPYKGFLRVSTEYELSLVKSQLHWLLLVHMKGSDEVYISIEVTTSDMSDMLHTMRIFDQESDPVMVLKATPVTCNHKTKLIHLCEIADSVVAQMGSYHLLRRNCQHFCNTFLEQLGFETHTYRTTIGPNTVPIQSVCTPGSDELHLLAADEHFDCVDLLAHSERSHGTFLVVLGTTMAKLINTFVVRLVPPSHDED